MTESKPTYRTEHDIQAQLIELLLYHHALVIRVNSGRAGHVAYNYWQTETIPSQTSGVSDLIALMPEGETWYIEVKTRRGRMRDKQDEFRNEVQRRGGIWLTSKQAFERLSV